MYPYTKKKDRNIVARFVKDNDLMYPVNEQKKQSKIHDDYIEDLINKPDFVKTYKANNKRSKEPLKKIISGLSGKEILLILLFTLAVGGLSYGVIKSEETQQTTKTQKSKNSAVILLMTLVGFGLGSLTAITFKQTNRESAIDSFYSRLVARYFTKLNKIDPDVFTEDIILNCNPEMTRVITAILMANMSEQDTKKIQEIALRVPCLHDDKDIETMKTIEAEIKAALRIIEQCFVNNPELHSLVKQAYTGHIPTTFVLNSENQKTK